MSDPYQILGVSPTATDSEIKDAYRKLAKKYHPDIHPDKALAEAKMKEINYAYDTIKRIRASKTSYQSNSNYHNSYANSSYSYNNNYRVVEEYIMRRDYYTAKAVLNNMDNYDSLWYYYSSIVNFNLGDFETARSQIDMACSLEPNNINYQRIRQQMYNTYQRTTRTYRTTTFSPFRLFWWIIRFFLIMSFIRFILGFMFSCLGCLY